MQLKVEIHRNETSQPIVYREADNAYTKGEMYCVLMGGEVHKYPLSSIFRVIETKEPSRSSAAIEQALRASAGSA
jgi:hypothetical protein